MVRIPINAWLVIFTVRMGFFTLRMGFFPLQRGIRNPWCQEVHYWDLALGLQDLAEAALLSLESKLIYFYVIVPYIYSTALRAALGSLAWAMFLVQGVFCSRVTNQTFLKSRDRDPRSLFFSHLFLRPLLLQVIYNRVVFPTECCCKEHSSSSGF